MDLFTPGALNSMKRLGLAYVDTEDTMALLAIILSGFVVALVAPLFAARLRDAVEWVLAVLPVALAAYFVSVLPRAGANKPLRGSYP
jgi:hypothetical protein